MTPISDQEFEAANRVGAAKNARGVAVAVRYFPSARRLSIHLSTDATLGIPVDKVRDLAGRPDEQLCDVMLGPGGRGLHFPQIDVDLSLEGLRDGLFASQLTQERPVVGNGLTAEVVAQLNELFAAELSEAERASTTNTASSDSSVVTIEDMVITGSHPLIKDYADASITAGILKARVALAPNVPAPGEDLEFQERLSALVQRLLSTNAATPRTLRGDLRKVLSSPRPQGSGPQRFAGGGPSAVAQPATDPGAEETPEDKLARIIFGKTHPTPQG